MWARLSLSLHVFHPLTPYLTHRTLAGSPARSDSSPLSPDERTLATAAWTLITFGLVSKREFQRKPRHFLSAQLLTPAPTRASTSPTPSHPEEKQPQTTTPENVRPLQPNHRPHLPPKHRHDNKLVRHPLQQQPIHQLSKQLHNLVFGSNLNNATMLRLGRRAQRRRLRVVLLPGQYCQDVGGFQSGFCGVFEEGGEGEGGCWRGEWGECGALL